MFASHPSFKRLLVLAATLTVMTGLYASPATADNGPDVQHGSSSAEYSYFHPCAADGEGELIHWSSDYRWLSVSLDTDRTRLSVFSSKTSATGVGAETGEQYTLSIVAHPDPWKVNKHNDQGFFLTVATGKLIGERGLLGLDHQILLEVENAQGERTVTKISSRSECK